MKFEKLKYFHLLFKHSSWVTHSVLVAVMKKHVSQKQILTFSYFYRREIVPVWSLIRKARTLYGLPSHTSREPATAAVFTGAFMCEGSQFRPCHSARYRILISTMLQYFAEQVL